MANQEQLDILKQGVKAWNQWRKEHPDVETNLSVANLIIADLNGANLNGANLLGATLNGATLNGADLSVALQLHFFGGTLPKEEFGEDSAQFSRAKSREIGGWRPSVQGG